MVIKSKNVLDEIDSAAAFNHKEINPLCAVLLSENLGMHHFPGFAYDPPLTEASDRQLVSPEYPHLTNTRVRANASIINF